MNAEKELAQTFITSWPVIVFTAGIIFQAGGIFVTYRYIVKELKRVKDKQEHQEKEVAQKFTTQEKEVTRKLYDDASMPRFVPIGSCNQCRLDLKTDIDKDFTHRDEMRRKEYDHLAGTIRGLDERVGGVENKVTVMDGRVAAVHGIMLEWTKKRREGNGG